MTIRSPLDLLLPRNATALTQHLLRLVGVEGYEYWCGGVVPVSRLSALCHKLAVTYPVTRNSRERSYDRKRGRAAMCLIVYPDAALGCVQNRTRKVSNRVHEEARRTAPISDRSSTSPDTVAWWLVSTAGVGGLADPTSPDSHVSKHAMDRGGHLTAGDYVLLYATKKEPRFVTDARTGHARTIYKSLSTWTWKLRGDVVTQLRASIDHCCDRTEYGAEVPPWGLRGILAMQRSRPMHSGVRNQVIDLHRYAMERWAPAQKIWRTRHRELTRRFGSAAGALRTIGDVVAHHLPKKRLLKVYDNPPRRIRDLIHQPGESECTERPNG